MSTPVFNMVFIIEFSKHLLIGQMSITMYLLVKLVYGLKCRIHTKGHVWFILKFIPASRSLRINADLINS